MEGEIVSKQMFTTIRGNEYCTPEWLFNTLNKEFNFSVDLASTNENRKCENNFTQNDDSLAKDWHKLDGWLWLNPPYSPLKPWIVKAQEENKKGAKIVVLCPPIITTRYFQNHLPSEIRFIVGRVPFLLDGIEMKGNTSDSCLLIYDQKIRQPKITYIERKDLYSTNPAQAR